MPDRPKAFLPVTRCGPRLEPDPSRVLLRAFTPGDEPRVRDVLARLVQIPELDAARLLEDVCARFAARHLHLGVTLQARFDQLARHLPSGIRLSATQQKLIGSYFLAEYSVEAAALFNPSLVPHPDQTGVPPGAVRIVLSLRATGEGHISSIVFRGGIIHADHRIELETPSGLLEEARQIPNPVYETALFRRRLAEMGMSGTFMNNVMDKLSEHFALDELRGAIDAGVREAGRGAGVLHEDHQTADAMWTLARSNYEVQFAPEHSLSERILFPSTPSQRNGIEDARFVRFQEENGHHRYYATFTAYDGRAIVPELVETADFTRFRFLTLNGPAALNKGMALFPRRIGGRFAMLGRQDSESISIMFSDNVHFWNDRRILLRPTEDWNLVQIGNCGSPIETPAGWLVLSHGVGPMRRYCIGAFLLDRDDPTRVIGRLRQPLLEPDPDEREGYVPNVVYSCGALVHDGTLVIPYGISDRDTGFATVPVDDLLAAM